MKFKIDLQFAIALLHLPKAKRKTVHRLLQSLDRDINSMADLIEYVAKDGDTQWMSFLSVSDFDTALTKARKILQESAANNIKMVSILDESYPPLLKACDDPPILLNYIGDIDLLISKPTIAIIGTRNPSTFGKKYANHIAGFFAKKGFNVISGLAKGCDTAAHLGCIDAGGATSAILAHGLDTIYPKENAALSDRIESTGVIISEYFTGTPLAKKNFIDRDRIQAGLALGVFIVECDINSGTMHTANYALSYNRILTCMKPPLEHFKKTRVEGNMLLTRSGKATGIYKNDELEELATLLILDKNR
jgi:DNA processing protein